MRSFVLLALLFIAGMSVALAGLEPTAPKNVDLSGLWQINPELSDDPKQIMDKKRDEAMSRRGGGMRGGMGGGMGGMGGMGGGSSGGMGGGPPGGEQRRGGRDSSEDSERGEPLGASFEEMLATQEQLDIKQELNSLTFSSIEDTSTCKTGEAAQVSLPDGNMADRQCGWKRKKFIIELKSPKGLTRTDQYELAKGAKQLVVITEIKGGRGPMSGLKIKRTYDRVLAH